MNAKAYRAGLLLVILLVIAVSAAAWSLHRQEQSASGDSAAPLAGDRRWVATYQYYLQEYEGKIGVFQMNETIPFRILEVYVSTLPSLDQLELREGVLVQDAAKLRVILEDYGS